MVARVVERFAQVTRQQVAGLTRPQSWVLLHAPCPGHLLVLDWGAGRRALPRVDLSENFGICRDLGRQTWAEVGPSWFQSRLCHLRCSSSCKNSLSHPTALSEVVLPGLEDTWSFPH